MAAPTIVDVYPANEATGVVIGDTIQVTFDQEMDETAINEGTFVVSGPDEDLIFGPDPWHGPQDEPGVDDEDILSSPYISGFVKGTISFQRVDEDGDVVDVDDTTGDGTLYRTRAIFTPATPFQPNKTYTVLVAGDESSLDTVDVGVCARTVFDTINTVAGNTGRVTFLGNYSGNIARNYIVKITAAGETGDAEYEWYREGFPGEAVRGITTYGYRELEYGVKITCNLDGEFDVGDEFKVVCIPAVRMANNYQWEFTTGSGAIETPTSSYSTTGLEEVEVGVDAEYLQVASAEPPFRSTNLSVAVASSIVITFNKTLDDSTVTDDTVTVWTEPVNGNPDIPAEGTLTKVLSVSGTDLTITLDEDDLAQNNIVFVQLDSTIAGTDAATLEEDYFYYITTTYDPLYSAIRRIRLDLGRLILEVPDDTINLALFEASLSADANSFQDTLTDGAAYYAYAKREYTTCLAELILVRALLGDFSFAGKMSKTLGDLQVSRAGPDLKLRESQLEECVARWQIPLQTGGDISPDTSLKPQYTVKGALASDAIGFGREWEPTSYEGEGYQRSMANTDEQATARRWVRTFRKRSR